MVMASDRAHSSYIYLDCNVSLFCLRHNVKAILQSAQKIKIKYFKLRNIIFIFTILHYMGCYRMVYLLGLAYKLDEDTRYDKKV